MMLLDSLRKNGSNQMPYPQYFRNPLTVTVNQLHHPMQRPAFETRKCKAVSLTR